MSATLRTHWRRHLLLWLMVITLSGCAALQPDRIQSSPNDTRDYRPLVLENQLKVLLISDPTTEKAAAALDVHVGSGQDPDNYEGLAHFLEHMLFLGTAKFPQAGEYQSFISQHGGSHNAYTAYENTNYFFDVQPEYLKPALDRFSQQFVAPLFTAEYVEREKNAVHSEFSSGLRDDSRRFFSALKDVINPDHPFAKFSVGNLSTLTDRPDQTVRQAMLDFYERFYSANQMRLVIYGREDLDTLERYARDNFTAIPNHERADTPVEQPLIAPESLPALLTVEPIKNKRVLSLMFSLPPIEPHYRAKPAYYLTNLIGHEGEGSLLSWLKQQGWADALSAGMALDNQQESALSVSITLTDEGLSQYLQVVRSTFAYIDLIRQQGIDRWRFDEQAKLLDIAYEFQQKSEPIHYVSALASNLHLYPANEVLRAPYRMDQYDPELYQRLLTRLTPEHVLITLMAPGISTDKTSTWYEAAYGYRNLTPAERQQILPTAETADLNLPPPNPFIPEDLKLLSGETRQKPSRLDTIDNLEAWYALDTSFGTPRANFYVSVRSPYANATPKESVLTELFVAVADDELNEYAYPARLAGLNYHIYKHMRGFTIRLEGYADKQETLLETALSTLTQLKPSQEQFDLAYDNLYRRLANAAQNKPYERTISEIRKLLLQPYWTEEEQLAALDGVTLSDLTAFIPKLLSKMTTVTLAHGNLSEDNAMAMNGQVVKHLTKVADLAPVERAKVVALKDSSNWFQQLQLDHNDTGFTWLFQGNDQTYRTRAQYALLAQLLSAPYYQDLRTERQLGYAVFATPLSLLEVPALAFVVQSPTATPAHIHQASSDFLVGFEDELTNMPDQAYDSYRRALAANYLERPKTLGERSERYWISIDEMNFDFDTREQIAKQILTLEKSELVEFYRQEFLSQATTLLAFSTGKAVKRDEPEKWQPEGFIPVESKSKLLQRNGLFPQLRATAQ